MNATGRTGRPQRRAAARALALVAMIAISCTTQAQAQGSGDAQKRAAPSGGAQTASGDLVTLNFRDADIDSVVGAFGHLLDRTFVIDPRVRGKMTLETPRPVTREQAYRLLQSALRSQGFAVVETGPLTKVVPEADAKLQSTPVSVGRAPAARGDEVVTQIFRLNYESATNLVPVLRPLISPNNTVVAYPNNNSLVVTDYAANVERIGRIIATLDSPSTREVEVMPVQYAVATDIAVAVQRLLEQPGGAGGAVDPGQRIVVMADPRTNSILLRAASPAKVGLAKGLIARLDQPSARPGNINVVYLRNAEAVKLAQTLRGVLGGGEGGSSASPAAGLLQQQRAPQSLMQENAPGQVNAMQTLEGSAGASLQSSQPQPVTVQAGGAIIAADPSTNSLIITAPEPIYRNLRAVIDKLDARRAQVFIESLIVEISAEKAAELGVQWQFLGSPQGSTRVIGGTNLPARGTGANILDAAANIATVGTGLNLGVVRGTINVPGVGEILNLGFLARALESGADANILATPNLLTLDNEEARIIIGQNVPFITGQFTATGTGGASVNPFQTIERRDVGTTLRVRPQVSESGTVRLQIFQEVSSVQDTRLAAGIITNRRAIESNVLVDDGQIIVLGGLIEERIDGAAEKVPGLGDVPVVGQLFRYDTRKRVKTNLLVFLRPVVIRDADDAYSVTADRYDYIRATRAGASLPPHWALPEFPPTPLRPMPAPVPGETGGRGPNPPEGGAPGDRGGEARSGAAVQGALLAPDATVVTQPPAPVVASRPSTVIRTAPNEVVVPLTRPGAPPPATESVAPPQDR